MIDPAAYIADEELLDGSIAHLRAIQPDDKGPPAPPSIA